MTDIVPSTIGTSTSSFQGGVFTYDSFITETHVQPDGPGSPSTTRQIHFQVQLDLNNPVIREMIYKADSNKNRRSGVGGGALRVLVAKSKPA